MNNTKDFYEILLCPNCQGTLRLINNKLVCKNKHSYQVADHVPIMTKLNKYLNVEAKAWESEWRDAVSKQTLLAYKYGMKVFLKLGYFEENGKAARLIPSKKDDNVLDLGCGNGYSTAYLKGKLVVGMDLSQKQMIRAKKAHKDKHFIVGNANDLPFKDNAFDMITAINLLHHVDNPGKVLKECHRVLRKGGMLLTVDPNLYNPVGFVGRGLYRLFRLKRVFPPFPHFALGSEEKQFTHAQYNGLFSNSPFNVYYIKSRRFEKLIFFASIIFPILIKVPFYSSILEISSRIGDTIVEIWPFSRLCYFWKCEAIK